MKFMRDFTGIAIDFIRFLMKSVALTVVCIGVLMVVLLFVLLGPRVAVVSETALSCVNSITDTTFKQSQNSYLLNDDGTVLGKLAGERDSIYLPSYKIPDKLKDMVIAVEDKRYMDHNGVDIKALGKAFIELFRNDTIVRGGSTISQQLARNIFLDFDQTFDRKLCEMIISIELEKRYSKAEILEFYLNNICYGGNVYGIAAASEKYFSKEVKDLSVNEMAYLVGIPKSPSRYNPMLGIEAGVARRNIVLDVLLREKVITEKEYEECLDTPIVLNVSRVEMSDYAYSYALHCSIEKLMEINGFEFEYVFDTKAEYEVYLEKYYEEYDRFGQELSTGGYIVKTSLQPELQKEVQEILTSSLKGEDGLQGAVTVVDVKTGLVAALVGGVNPNEDYSTFNRAYQAYRQPGSAIKPLVAYLPYLEVEGVDASTVIPDRRREDGIRNYDDSYWYNVSIRKAIQLSKNVPAVWCMEQLGVKECMETLADMGFQKIVEDYNPSAALGGLTYGVSTVEMAGAYATIANGGTFRPADCIVSINKSDKPVYIRDDVKGARVYEEDATEEVKVGLRDVLTGGTGAYLGVRNAWAKTGTTTDNKDSWFCGFNADWAVAVWTGHDIPKTVKKTELAGRVWKSTLGILGEQTAVPTAKPAPIQTPEPVQQSGVEEYLAQVSSRYNEIMKTTQFNVIDAYELLEEMKAQDFSSEMEHYIDALEEHIKQF